MGKVAVRQADLPDHITERAGEQPPEDFPFDQWREHPASTLGYPAPMHGSLRAMLQFAGATVDGETSAVYPPLLESDVRY